MEIIVDKQIKIVPPNYSLQQLLDELFPNRTKGLAAAVNEMVIPKSGWKNHILQPKDQLIFIKATQGG